MTAPSHNFDSFLSDPSNAFSRLSLTDPATRQLESNILSTELPIDPPQALEDVAEWYEPRGIPGFDICGTCFKDKVLGTRFQFEFTQQDKTSRRRRCRFCLPRMVAVWEEVLRLNDIQPFEHYIQLRTWIPDCQSGSPQYDGVQRRWFVPVDGSLPIAACEACYTDIISATSFRTQFDVKPHIHYGQFCFLASEAATAALLMFAKNDDWYGFIHAAQG